MANDNSPERALHDALIVLNEANLESIVSSWRENGRIQPFMVSWPEEPVPAVDGTIITDVVMLELPADPEVRKKEVRTLVERTKPCALLMCEQYKDKVLVVFESPLGTKSWTYPIKDHGGTLVLGDRSSRENTDSIGILWRAN